jgi:bile acid:Na+ symporter, BASS family
MSLNQFFTIISSPSNEILNAFNFIISFGLVILMFYLGLKINFSHIKKNFAEPKSLLTGLFIQIILIPVLALIYISATNFLFNIQLGIMIIACMPSAATSNYITSKVNGDLSLSVILTSFCTLFSILSIPFYLNLFALITTQDVSILNLDYSSLIIKIFIFITLPILVGATFKYYWPNIIKIEKNLGKISLVLFIIIMKLAIYLSIINIQNPSETFIAVFFFMIILITLVSFVLKLSNSSLKITKTLYTEALLQNNALGFMLVFSISANSSGLLPILAMYAVGQYIIIVLLLFILFKSKLFISSEKI